MSEAAGEAASILRNEISSPSNPQTATATDLFIFSASAVMALISSFVSLTLTLLRSSLKVLNLVS